MFGVIKNKFTNFISSLAKKKEEDEEIKENIKVDLSLVSKIKGIFTSRIKLTESDLTPAIDELKMNLINSDVAYETSEKICEKIFNRLKDKEINKNEIDKFVNREIKNALLEILNDKWAEGKFMEWAKTKTKPIKIVFFGINGTGKTTTIAKFGKFLIDNNKSVVFAAGDTFRAGAIDQISIHGGRLGIKVIKQEKRGVDAAAVIYDAIEYAKAHYIDFVLADTAGRMQTNKDLMNEMKKIVRVMKPDLKVFVADALTGNDAIEQAREFNNATGIDAVIIAKMDIAKGGCALSIAHTIQKPIIFIGVGQRYEDFREFDAKWFVEGIVGG